MTIIHVDMDAFFASVEQRDRPELRGVPVVVGGPPERRGVVAAASYEARAYGIRSAMPSARARRLCPKVVFVAPRFSVYQAVSEEIRALFFEVTAKVEPLSLDEAYLDVSPREAEGASALCLATRLKEEIRSRTGLSASAGVGPNKLVAKLASALQKPDGLVFVPDAEVDAFLEPLAVRRLFGVGPVTARKLEAHGLHQVSDLRRSTPAFLEGILGRFGRQLYDLAHGRDDRPVVTDREAKSVGVERTFPVDLSDEEEIARRISGYAEEVSTRVKRSGRPGRTVTVKVRYPDFTTVTRSRSLPSGTMSAARITEAALELLADTEAGRRPVRLLGVSLGGLSSAGAPLQLELFETEG